MQNTISVTGVATNGENRGAQATPAPSPESVRLVGMMAGQSIYTKFMSETAGVLALVRELAGFFKTMGGGILRVEEADDERRRFAFTVLHHAAGPDGGGADPTQGAFQEGLIAGVLSSYYGAPMEARLVDQWGRERIICRYVAGPAGELRDQGSNGLTPGNGAAA